MRCELLIVLDDDRIRTGRRIAFLRDTDDLYLRLLGRSNGHDDSREKSSGHDKWCESSRVIALHVIASRFRFRTW